MFSGLFNRTKRTNCHDMPPVSDREASAQFARFDATIKDISDAVLLAKSKHEEVVRKNELLEALIYAAGGYIWLKGPDGAYKWCDHKFCEDFFGLATPHCDVRGLNDMQLINSFRTRTSLRHSFVELCMSTDAHCLEQLDQCRYIEIGYIGDSLFALDVVKTPMYHDGVLRGIVGFGQNRTDDCCCLDRQLGLWVKDGRAVRLAPPEGEDTTEARVGAWWIKPCSEQCSCELSQFFCHDKE